MATLIIAATMPPMMLSVAAADVADAYAIFADAMLTLMIAAAATLNAAAVTPITPVSLRRFDDIAMPPLR